MQEEKTEKMKQIDELYSKFFDEFKIDEVTGVVTDFPNLKFMTMPYIGSKYYNTHYKIIFVGMDVGKDEKIGSYHNFEFRRTSIETDNGFNPHIAGTYGTALFFLKDKLKWESVWKNMKNFPTFYQATKIAFHSENQNPLSHIALTNLHKFVTVERKLRAGGENRKFLNVDLEEKLLLEELYTLKPDVVVFQGKLPREETIEKIKNISYEIYLAPHPSNRKKNGRNPINYISNLKKI